MAYEGKGDGQVPSGGKMQGISQLGGQWEGEVDGASALQVRRRVLGRRLAEGEEPSALADGVVRWELV